MVQYCRTIPGTVAKVPGYATRSLGSGSGSYITHLLCKTPLLPWVYRVTAHSAQHRLVQKRDGVSNAKTARTS